MPIPRKPINPKTPLEVRKTLKINGRTLAPGMPFDWRRMSVAWYRTRQLYEGGFIIARNDGLATSPVLSDLEQAYIDELPLEGTPSESSRQQNSTEVIHLGGGWYDVLVNGNAINEVKMRKAEAEAFAATVSDDLLN